MNIVVKFLNGNSYWQAKILVSAGKASAVLSDPVFLAKVRAVPKFDFTSDTPAQVGDKLAAAGDVTVSVGFFSKWFTKEIAFEDAGGFHFNTRKEAQGAGGPGDIAHELCHELGWLHRGNARSGNENSAPYWIGDQVDAAVEAET